MMNKKLVKAGTAVALIAAMGGLFLVGCAQKVNAADNANVKVKTVLDRVCLILLTK